MVSARAIFFESPLPLERWNRALPRLTTIAASTMRMRILIGSMRPDFILPAPMPIRFSAFGRVFAPSWPMTLATVLLLAAFVSLGRWQWQRGEAKQAVWSEYERRAPARDLGTRDPDTVERFAHIRMSGRFDAAHQFLLDNRSHAGKPGYEVLTPFESEGGGRMLVNRGWVPFSGYRDRLPDVSLPRSEVISISGYVDELPASGLASGRAAPQPGTSWPKLTSFPSHAELESALGGRISRRVLLLDAEAPAGYVREWKPPGLAPTRHFSYAIQWWGFAVVLLVIYFGLNFRKVS
jgi:surfeit locus 1 family protein